MRGLPPCSFFTASGHVDPKMRRTVIIPSKNNTEKVLSSINNHVMILTTFVAVRGHKGWGGLFKAKYSLAVSFEAINQDIPIYEPIRTEIEATIENQEIEVEMPDSK